MSLLRPEAFPVLLLAPVLFVLLWALDRAMARRFLHMTGPRAAALAPTLSPARRRWGRGLFCGAFLLALLAMLQPLWGETARAVERRGIDIVVCLDVSRSMLARDVAPDRLERAKQEIRELAERAGGDRIGLVLFAGEARLVVPLTRDLDSLAEMAKEATPLSIETGGSDLGSALDAALAALGGRGGDQEVIVLLTDGEDLEGRALHIARSQPGIPVHCVGFGTALGAKIPIEGAFLRNASGGEVVSALEPSTLRRIAQATGGEYLAALGHESPLVGLYDEHIQPMARESIEAAERLTMENRFQWPLLAAFLFWIVELCLGERKRL